MCSSVIEIVENTGSESRIAFLSLSHPAGGMIWLPCQSFQQADAANTGPGQADYIANSIFYLRKKYRNECGRIVAGKCYLSNRLSANL